MPRYLLDGTALPDQERYQLFCTIDQQVFSVISGLDIHSTTLDFVYQTDKTLGEVRQILKIPTSCILHQLTQ